MAKNVTSWKPGQSGNPHGKPRREKTIASVLRAKLDTGDFCDRLIELAKGGEGIDSQTQLGAMRLILNYVDGLPIARAEVDHDETVRIEVNYVQTNRVELTRPASGAAAGNPGGQALQRPIMREALGQDSLRPRALIEASATGHADGLDGSDLPIRQRDMADAPGNAPARPDREE